MAKVFVEEQLENKRQWIYEQNAFKGLMKDMPWDHYYYCMVLVKDEFQQSLKDKRVWLSACLFIKKNAE